MQTADYPKKMKENVFLTWKEVGETPLQALERLREQEGINADVSMTYAGRLDPLAEGELLILVGEQCKRKQEYLGLDKEYEVEILLGPHTDTGDVMGIIVDSLESVVNKFRESILSDVLKKFIGKLSWPYPAFSSKTVEGKHLFLWALEGKINEIAIPVRESKIYELELLSTEQLNISELRSQVHSKINSIKPVPVDVESKRIGADFRREEVLESWANFFNKCSSNKCSRGPLEHFDVVRVRCRCSSGTYMRTLAQKIGEELGTPALALSIVRTEVVV